MSHLAGNELPSDAKQWFWKTAMFCVVKRFTSSSVRIRVYRLDRLLISLKRSGARMLRRRVGRVRLMSRCGIGTSACISGPHKREWQCVIGTTEVYS